MASTRPSAAHASVVFLRIIGFAQQPVAEQARLKAWVEERVAAALPALRDDERIVLEGSEATAVVVLANPRAALEFARRVQPSDPGHSLAVGLTHGPVRISHDGADSIVHGDGVVAAEAISAFAREGAIAVSREFRDALARSGPAAARYLPAAYETAEAGDRSFELLHVDERSLEGGRRRFLAVTAGACVAIVALGGIVRWASSGGPSPPGQQQAALPRAAAPVPAPVPEPRKQPGTIVFDIRPAGDIFVNGAQKGSAPPLKSIQLPPGTHTIEIRNAKFPPMVTTLTIAAGEELAVAHTFAAPKAKPKPPEKGFWRGLADKLKP